MIKTDEFANQVILAVDLDGTLIDGDMLYLSARRLVFGRPWMVLLLPLWLRSGRAALKHKIAERTELDVSRLNYRIDVLEFIRERRKAGQKVVLATASNLKFATQVADHLGLFDAVMASTENFNLKAGNKALELSRRYSQGFEYLGDSRADLPVWRASVIAHLVKPDPDLERLAANEAEIGMIFR